MEVKEWLRQMSWNANPFTFAISPELLVGYKGQIDAAKRTIDENHKISMILGPTGSGKTTLINWLIINLPSYDVIYVSKPPAQPEHFIDIFNEKYSSFLGLRRIKNMYQVASFLNKRLANRRLIVFFDEAQESSIEVLEWLRVLSDQVTNMQIVLAGLPVFEEKLIGIETFRKRVAAKIELLYLTKEETIELVRRRLRSVGGSSEFDGMMDYIYDKSAGFPREIIRICNELINNAIIKGTTEFVPLREELREDVKPPPSFALLEKMTPLQKEVLERLSSKAMTPGDIANSLDLSKYKSRQHAVRSINNVVKRLFEDGYLERVKEDKAFIYNLAPRIKTMFVRT